MSSANVRMYANGWCGFCAAARKMLKGKNVDFTEIDVDAIPEERRKMEELSGRRTVPQIFINDQSIGGYDDMAALNASGELDKLLGLK